MLSATVAKALYFKATGVAYDPSSSLMLWGAAAGAAFGVIGAVAVEEWKRRQQRISDLRSLARALRRLRDAAGVMITWTQQPAGPQNEHFRNFAEGAAILEHVMGRAEIYNDDLWVRMVYIREFLSDKWKPALEISRGNATSWNTQKSYHKWCLDLSILIDDAIATFEAMD